MKAIWGTLLILLIAAGCRATTGGHSSDKLSADLAQGKSVTLQSQSMKGLTKWTIVASREGDEMTVAILDGHRPVYGILLLTNGAVVIEEATEGVDRRVISKRVVGRPVANTSRTNVPAGSRGQSLD